MGVAAIVIDVGVGAVAAAQVFLFMSTFNALLTSISFDDQGAYEVGFAAGVDAGGADVDAGVGAVAGGDATRLSDDDWWSTTDDD